jgi:hypothetical protein
MERCLKLIAVTTLTLSFGVADINARERPVKMTFSGSIVPTSIAVQANTITDEELLEGEGSLGRFTFRKLRTDALAPQPSSTCAGLNIPVVAGGGVFRFQDGSLLTVLISEGGLCINLAAMMGHLTETYRITGGTGRFSGASGSLTSTATLRPVLAGSGGVVLLTSTGRFEGEVETRDEQ